MKQYIDEQGNKHYAVQKYAKDSQGILYTTKNNTLILRDSENRSDHGAKFKEIPLWQTASVDRLILPAIFLVPPETGYVMEIPEGFIPLSSLLYPSEENGFLQKTGGIRRRLEILLELARILLSIHNLPAIYGGLSPSRILIDGTNSQKQTVYLLYSVDMSFQMNLNGRENKDEYQAPEVLRGSFGDIYSDGYAFGTLAYDLLTINGTQPLPTEDMELLFQQMVDQKDHPSLRPGIHEFCLSFRKALDTFIHCPKCSCEIRYGQNACPACGGPTGKILKALIYDKISNTVQEKGMKMFRLLPERQYFTSFHTGNVSAVKPEQRTISFYLHVTKEKKLEIVFTNHLEKEIQINGSPVASGGVKAVTLPCDKVLLTVPVHRVTNRHIEMTIL